MKIIFTAAALVLILSEALAVPAFYNVREHGARGDGSHLDTKAIQSCIDEAGAGGGGKVVIPAGTYLTGPIFVTNNLCIEIQPGAVLLGSTNVADYPVIFGRWEGIERKIYASLLTGKNLHNLSIIGGGLLNGQGQPWWQAHRRTMGLRKSAGLAGREPENPPGSPLPWPRPRLINLYSCTNVVIRDVNLLNSPSWNIHPVYCENLLIDNLTVIAPFDSPNTDAVDPDSCRDVRISNSHFDVGDDDIVIKSGYNEDGRRVGVACENIAIINCTFAHGHGGVVIGSEMSGSVRNVTVDNCIFDGTQRGLRVKTAMGRGGVIENFRASNLVMRNILDTAFSVSCTYDGESAGAGTTVPNESIPHIRHIDWTGITIENTKKVADVKGLPKSQLEDFALRDIRVSSSQHGISCAQTRNVVFENISINCDSSPLIALDTVTNVSVFRSNLSAPAGSAAAISLRQVSHARIHDCAAPGHGKSLLDAPPGTNEDIQIE